MAQGDWIDPARGRVTLGEYAPDWLEGRTGVKPRTLHQQASILRLHVLPTWQAVQLDRITFEGTHWVAGLTASGLGPSGVRQAVYLMSARLHRPSLGEATALRVCDVDLGRRRVDVRRAFSDVGGKIILGTPKSHLTRTVPLPGPSL